MAYTLPALSKALQAIGRLIRDERDRGVILLCDARFRMKGVVEHLPEWIRDEMVVVGGRDMGIVREWMRQGKEKRNEQRKEERDEQRRHPKL
ncbi:hypothetical protein DRN72_00975 [Methanosarcinales archaeon]|nr:MAG: hypothetical protein DRN72_00975 [Methanosarcinales archaeon]